MRASKTKECNLARKQEEEEAKKKANEECKKMEEECVTMAAVALTYPGG
jgi:hypothetical protein